MKKIETVQQFKRFLDSNRDKLLERAIKVEELPPDDEWIQDIPGMKYINRRKSAMEKYNIGDVWWIIFHMKTRTRKKEDRQL